MMQIGELEHAQLDCLSRDPAVRVLYANPRIAVGEFHLSPHDPRWSEENCTDEGHFVAFPGTSVVIKHTGRAPAVATANEVVLYNRGQTYRRGLLDRSGDHCSFLMVAPSLLADVSAALGSAPAENHVAFSSTLGPVAARTFMLQRVLVRTLRGRDASALDDLGVEEALYRVAFDAARIGLGVKGAEAQPRRRRRTLSVHAVTVEETKALVARRLAERLSLEQIARAMHVSPFHLARVFREHTGFGVHEYRDQLRLRLALDRILDRDVTLSALALEVGYASHSHLTDNFRRLFGVAPSTVRRSMRGPGLSQLRDQLVAPP